MNSILRNILAVIAGIFIGGMVNMAIINISGSIIPPPNGADVTTTEGLKATMHLFEPKHYIMPFLAHALGTFVGALVAAIIAANNKMRYAIIIAVFFLFGGIGSVFILPSPLWFTIIDLLGAYLFEGYLAGKIIENRLKK